MKMMRAFAGSKMFSAKGRRTFVMVRLEFDTQCRLIAEPVELGASGAITTLANADVIYIRVNIPGGFMIRNSAL